MKNKEIDKVFKILKKKNPSPTTELNYENVFTLLVAVVMSAQSTDKGVNKATDKLFKIANTPEKMMKLGEKKIRDFLVYF